MLLTKENGASRWHSTQTPTAQTKHRRQAWDYLAQARELKTRIANGEAYDWELGRVLFFVTQARLSMRLYRHGCELRALGM